MFLITPFQRSVLSLMAVIVASLFFSAASTFAFQTFEEFSRSKNKISRVSVTAFTDPVEAKPGENFDLHLSVTLSQGWHIYSLKSQGKDESLATQIRFKENIFEREGRWIEPEPIISLDGALDKVVKVHENAVRFSRRLRVPDHLKPGTYPVSGEIEYRACDNRICSLPKAIGFQTRLRILRVGF